ncbi:ATP-binding protein [Fulvivirga imtechensis]|uniref:ATP-binding protein n=1 Tax=Fulvivirga imtechensis TaxID=881893 RepID=UPI00161C2CF3|nr:ATP-binding protein [Fulvivirga imtechensis]
MSIACLIEEYAKQNISIEFRNNNNQYLKDVRFSDYWTENFDRDRFTPTFINTALCLWHISKEMMFNYAFQAQRYYETHYFDGLTLDPMNTAMGEIFNNIFDHSRSTIQGYVFTQYYQKKEKIVTSVCDFGIGIPNAVNEMWKREKGVLLSDESALRIALRKRFTTQSTPNNKGFGLDNLKSIANALKGRLNIISNYASYIQYPTGINTYETKNISFPGTLVSLELDCRYLPEMEQEIVDDEFFL